MSFVLPAESVSATLAYVRMLIMGLERRDPRRAARLLLDFLDVRTDHQAGRLNDEELRTELQRIGAETEVVG
ncbi:hypothetical protein ACFSBZ_07470 [Amnibacterium flavum]|uniref:hypothetical protein n=1 Tax=Amnibacterium flavum TaxID=2173173 RepID=UPI001057FF5B|nr:hypothetical protein [Amnibacterium flavum]